MHMHMHVHCPHLLVDLLCHGSNLLDGLRSELELDTLTAQQALQHVSRHSTNKAASTVRMASSSEPHPWPEAPPPQVAFET